VFVAEVEQSVVEKKQNLLDNHEAVSKKGT
jgi:hypothetical protein